MLITDYISYHATIRPQSPMLLQAQGRNYSFGQAVVAANQCAHLLSDLGISRGDRIAILAQNSPEHIVLLLAAAQLGAVLVPLNYRLAVPELAQIIEDSQAKLLLANDSELADLNDSLLALLPVDMHFMDAKAFSNALAEHADRGILDTVEPLIGHDENAVVLQLYTSGTTGKPKGVLISHQNLISLALGSWAMYRAKPGVGTVDLLVAPFFHIGGLGSVMVPLLAGGAALLHKQFNPVAVVDAFETMQVNTCFMVPAMIQAILSAVPDIASRDFSSLKQICYGASPISHSLLEQAMAVFKCDFYQAYGMTETSGGVVFLLPEDHVAALAGRPELLQSCGRANLGGEVKVVGSNGVEVERGATGEIAIRSPLNMQGYWQRPDETAKTLRDGWIYTGDAGYMDDQGYIYMRDRIKDMVVTGGENVYPVEVEKVLVGHPAILEAAVIGVPDDKYGEALLAVCVAVDGAELNDEAIISYCRDHIAGYKIPRQFKWVEQLPRNPSGKLLKTELRNTYWAGRSRQL